MCRLDRHSILQGLSNATKTGDRSQKYVLNRERCWQTWTTPTNDLDRQSLQGAESGVRFVRRQLWRIERVSEKPPLKLGYDRSLVKVYCLKGNGMNGLL